MMLNAKTMLLCAGDVGEPAPDDRFPGAYAGASAALLGLFSAEVLAVKRRWPGWGIPVSHFPAFPLFVGIYGIWREATLVDGAFDRAVKEVICACVSASNECKFCSNGHAVCARLGGVDGALTLVRERSATHITDERMRSLSTWALSFRDPDAEAVRHPPPMSPRDAAELLATVLHVIYKNVFATIFVGHDILPDAFPAPLRAASHNPLVMAGVNRAFQSLMMARPVRHEPGRIREVWAALPLPFDASAVELPDHLWWAAPNAVIADALRYMVSEQARVERRWLSPPVAAAVRQFVATEFHGQVMELPSLKEGGAPSAGPPAWAAAAVPPDVVGEDDVYLVSFILTAALAAPTVTAETLEAFRRRFHPTGEAELMLREVVSWAAWTVSLRVVGWMAVHASPRGKRFV